MPPARRLTKALRSSLLLTGALALLGTVGVAPAAAAGGPMAEFATSSSDSPVTVTISAVQQPGAATGDPLNISGTVTNTSTSTLTNAQLGLALGAGKQPLLGRSAISDLSAHTPSNGDGQQLSAPVTTVGDLAPGASVPFTLPQVAQSDLKLPRPGVYELAVEVDAGSSDDSTPHQVGIARTLLPYSPSGTTDSDPSQVATLWPLTHAPELVAQTMPDADQTPVLRDDNLATELKPDGRLGQLLSLGKSIPSLTWVIDPDLLDAVYAMTKPYRVQLPGPPGTPARDDTTTAGTGRAVATQWLADLRDAVTKSGDEVVALPYGDPDLASIAHNGGNLPALNTALSKAQQAGQLTVEGRLSLDHPQDDVAWPYQGYLDQQTAQVAQQLGASRVVVNSSSVTDPRSLNYTPSAARPLPNGLTAVVADSTIADLLQSYNPSAPGAKAAIEQRLLAETLATSREQPHTSRTLVVMPPRNLSADTAQVLQESLLKAQGQWVRMTTLDQVTSAPADPATDGTVIAPADNYPGALRGAELPISGFQEVASTQNGMDQLLRILTLQNRVSSPFSAAILRSVSTSWRGAEPAGSSYRQDVQNYLTQLTGAVFIPKKSSKITLAGDEGLIQVSVRNELTQPVTNLELRLTSSQPTRLNVSKQQDIVLSAGQSTSLKFLAQAKGNGPVQMTAQLYTTGPDAQRYGPEVTFTVEVSQVTSGVWWVVGAGGALVLLAGLRFFLQRRKRSGEPDEDPDAPLIDPDAPEGTDGAATADGEAAPLGTDPYEPDGQAPTEGAAAHP
ncbi:DUF6049 family protein [Kitasatospora sp. NBC_01266]|uniref:DUF6049 family protein n=1 Tax=Kitasatospora sp. NBC_01266 TaxID=2903572 RepID=UPI002E329FA6|nr:DUF6049 family protein [Kitasatospora sp. NBC_01266]